MSHQHRRADVVVAAVVALALVLGGATRAGAYLVQSVADGSGVARAHWNTDEVAYRLDEAGSDDLGAEATLPILREAFAVWESVEGSRLRFRDDGVARGRGDSRRDGVNLLIFDETGAALGAPAGSGIIAVTRLRTADDGRILDADILFNGRDYRFSATARRGFVHLGDVAVHEIGHLAGLEHTPLGGTAETRPTMSPFYVGDAPGTATTLEADDEAGIAALYPAPAWSLTTGRVEGRVTRLQGAGVFGAHVIAEHLDTGTRVSTLTGAETGSADPGFYRIAGLPPGPYRIAVEPLPSGVDESNFSGLFQGLESDFPAEFHGNTAAADAATPVDVAAGSGATTVDITTGFINPGEPYILPLETPGNTPDAVGPYRFAFDIPNADTAELLVDTGAGVETWPLTRDGGERFVADLAGRPAGTQVRYRVRAVADTGIESLLPADGGWLDFDVIALSGAPLAFTVLRAAGSVGVFDTESGVEVSRIAVGQDPIQILDAPGAQRLYVSDLGAGDVAVVDAASFRVVDRIAVADEPLDMALSADGATLYVTNSGAAAVTAIDVGTGAVVARRPLELAAAGPFGIAAAPAAIYVTDLDADAVVVLRADGSTARIAVPGGPRSLAATADGGRVLVTSFDAGTLTILDTGSESIAAVVDLAIGGGFAVAVDDAGRRAYVTGHADGVVAVVDLDSLSLLDTIEVGADPRGLSLSDDDALLYVTTAGDGQIRVLDTRTLTAVATLPTGDGPRGIAVLSATDSGATDVDESAALPVAWGLTPAWPNPFNATTSLGVDVPVVADGEAAVVVYDVLGQRVRRIDLGARVPGRHVVHWAGDDDDGRPVAGGVYLVALRAPGVAPLARKVLLLR